VITTAFADKQVEKLLKSQNMPCVFVDRVNDVISGVSANHFEGGELQAQLILEGKPQNILIIHLDLKINTFKSRINGIESILKQYNVKYFYYESEKLTNEQAFISLIKNLKIDSIICSNDILAIETMAIIQQFKFKVPEDIQIVGYDNIPFSTMTFPNISTIDQSAYVLGQKAVSKLLNLKTNDYDKQLVLSPKRRGSIRF
jgi:LacI family transcriptional regulator